MPPVPAGDWLLGWLFQAGPLASDGMGARGLSWPELAAWRKCTQVLITPWEMQALHRMSASYAGAYHAAEKPDCPAYWLSPELTQLNVSKSEAAGQQLKSVFGAMAKKGLAKAAPKASNPPPPAPEPAPAPQAMATPQPA